jgi:hypothetical protein
MVDSRMSSQCSKLIKSTSSQEQNYAHYHRILSQLYNRSQERAGSSPKRPCHLDDLVVPVDHSRIVFVYGLKIPRISYLETTVLFHYPTRVIARFLFFVNIITTA